MAFADTAPLVALLKLDDKFSGPLKNAQKTLGQFDAKLGQTSTRAFRAGQQIGTGIKNGLKIAAGAFVAISALLLQSAKEGQQAANVQKVYAQAIANSGKVSQAQVAILDAQQQALLNLAGVDDELIKTEQTRLIQMGLSGNAVAKLTPLILDLAKATGKDLLAVTLAVGKAALGNSTALQRLGIILPKTAKATKSAALASLELKQQQLKLAELNEKAQGPLTKQEKAYYAHAKAVLAAKIAQQKLTDSQQKGTKTASDLDTTIAVLEKRFGGTTAALSGSLDVRLAVLRERLANVREEAGIRLLPVMTRIVDVVGQKLVPAFGDFIQAILPRAIDGLNKLARFLDSGGATETLNTFLNTAKSVAPAIQKSAEITGKVISTAVGLFKSLPPEIQSLAIAGLAINKLTGGLVTNLAGGLISAVISSFRGMMNVNAAVVNVTGFGGGGALPVSPAGASGWTALFGLILPAAIVAALAKGSSDFANSEFSQGGIKSNFQPPGSGILPFGIGSAAHNLLEIIRLAQGHIARDIIDPRGDRTLRRDTFGPPTTVARNATGALAGAMTGAARATKAFTTAAFLAGRTLDELRAQEKAARGKQFRIAFTASGKPSETLPVVDYLVRGFTISQAPFYRNMDNAKRALEAIKADQRRAIRQGDTVTAGKLGQRIRELEGVIKRSKTTVNVTVPVTTTINGRIIGSALTRFTTTVGNLGLTTGNLGGAVGGN